MTLQDLKCRIALNGVSNGVSGSENHSETKMIFDTEKRLCLLRVGAIFWFTTRMIVGFFAVMRLCHHIVHYSSAGVSMMISVKVTLC